MKRCTFSRAVVFCCCLLSLTACLRRLTPNPGYDTQLKRENTIVQLLASGTKLLRSGTEADLSLARAQFELARELAPDDPRVWDALGSVEYRRDNKKLAEYFFRETLRRNPNYDRAYVHLALIAEARGDLAAAEELLHTAVQMNPMNIRARNNLAAFIIDHESEKPSRQNEAYGELLKIKSKGVDSVVKHNLDLLEEARF